MIEGGSRWLALAFLLLAQFMIVLDISVVNVALPSILREFDLSVTQLQAIVTAYTLFFGGLLLLGGRAADLFGRRLVFLSGVVGFTAVSFLIGIADSEKLMVPLRALQGLCGALIAPSALSLVLTIFKDSPERTRALSFWGAVSAGGAMAGLLIGGVITQYFGWRWIFFINVPVGAFVIWAALQLLTAHEAEERDRSLDLPGAVLATSGLMLLVYTISHAHIAGWSQEYTLGALAISLALLIAFVINEHYSPHPLVPFSIFKIGNVAAANIIQFPITASVYATFFFVSLYVQHILHFSPLHGGLAFLPVSFTVALGAILAPRLIARVGVKPILVAAPLLVVVGMFIFAQATALGTYLDILPGLLITAAGLGFAYVSLTISATTGVPAGESGLASGLLSTSQQIGGSLGLAILTAIASASSLRFDAAAVSPQVMLEGFHTAFYTGMIFALAASILALLLIRTHSTQKGKRGLENLPVR